MYPKTRAEAEAHRYRCWAGSGNGSRFRPENCAAEVPDGGRSVLFHQCHNVPGKGPDGLFCAVHAKKAKP